MCWTEIRREAERSSKPVLSYYHLSIFISHSLPQFTDRRQNHIHSPAQQYRFTLDDNGWACGGTSLTTPAGSAPSRLGDTQFQSEFLKTWLRGGRRRDSLQIPGDRTRYLFPRYFATTQSCPISGKPAPPGPLHLPSAIGLTVMMSLAFPRPAAVTATTQMLYCRFRDRLGMR